VPHGNGKIDHPAGDFKQHVKRLVSATAEQKDRRLPGDHTATLIHHAGGNRVTDPASDSHGSHSYAFGSI
jgi:hypothetical protein